MEKRARSRPPKPPEFLEEFAWHLILINHSYATCVESLYCTTPGCEWMFLRLKFHVSAMPKMFPAVYVLHDKQRAKQPWCQPLGSHRKTNQKEVVLAELEVSTEYMYSARWEKRKRRQRLGLRMKRGSRVRSQIIL